MLSDIKLRTLYKHRLDPRTLRRLQGFLIRCVVRETYSNVHIDLWCKCVDCPGGAIQKNEKGKQKWHELHAFRLYYQPLYIAKKDQFELHKI